MPKRSPQASAFRLDYPHVMHHDGALYVAFATAKSTVEVLSIRVADLAMLEKVPLKKRVD